ncbi:hypothetical protein LJK88_35905 [Paenibacillus sp. P26]|nr:hypothetical protein LJK88_35905 [Paenibacillus sp. P26]UUZ97093.1 hypothetical protein LJK87_02325 [Paenibacillus sp. P25]
MGFLAAGVVFRSTPYGHWGHTLALMVGVGAVLLGGLVLALATKDYFTKREGINRETFRAPALVIWLVFASLGLLDIFLLALVLVLLLF